MIIPSEDHHFDLEEVYSLKLFNCNTKTCKVRKKNCRQNPSCLQNLGEKKWFSQSSANGSNKLEELVKDEEIQPGEHPGLTNLGATCYVNSLLQLWFHNPAFRNAVYKWNSLEDSQELANPTIGTAEYHPISPLGHLQMIFAFLQFGLRKVVDPAMFVVSLGLDSMIQQDAQEFSKLFISLLEEKFNHQSDPGVNSLVKRKLRGSYEYVTKCLGCNSETCSPTPFYELNLNLGSSGRHTLEDSLAEFLSEECLEGDNQYFCSNCNSRQNAVRRIRLIELSPVLNFQLMRFVYDRNAGHKKKVHTPFQFPETIDMTGMVEGSKGSVQHIYDLRAVLIHQGSSAYSGHYIAHIFDSASGQWFKFNDEVVEKIEGRKLKLGNEDNGDGFEGKRKTGEKSKLPKGTYSSTNAYMLVYSRKDETSSKEKQSSLDLLPEWLRDIVETRNAEFRSSVQKQIEEETNKNEYLKNARSEILTVYRSLARTPNDEWELIDTSWLKRWLNQDPSQEPFNLPIDNNQLLCLHEKVHIEAMKDFKVVTKAGADVLYAKYGGGPRFDKDSLCASCAAGSLARKKMKAATTEDAKRLATLLKISPEPKSDTFWVGKDSLRRWRRLATEKVEELFPMGFKQKRSKTPDSREDSGSGDDVKVIKTVIPKPGVIPIEDGAEDSDTSKDQEILFNEDTVCKHGQLSWASERRRLITAESWALLKKYFADSKEFSADADPCRLCMETVSREEDLKNTLKVIAKEQKDNLFDLYRGKGRPVPSQFYGDLFIVSWDFLSQWRAYLRDPGRNQRPESLLNETLLCIHRGFVHLPAATDFGDSQSPIHVLRQDEWDTLSQYVTVDVPVILKCPELSTVPAICEECISARTSEEMERMLQYRNARVFVRLLPQEDKKNGVVEEEVEEYPAKKLRLDEVSIEADGPPVLTLDELQSAARRSQRHRKTRGEKEIIISSNDTLKELKVQVMKKFSVATFDQRLFHLGKELTNSGATLSNLQIVPGSILTLVADEPPEDAEFNDIPVVQHPEEGFKGTILLN